MGAYSTLKPILPYGAVGLMLVGGVGIGYEGRQLFQRKREER